MTSAISDLLQHAAEGGRISPDEALLLYTDAPLHALGEAADSVRRRRYPDNIATYIIDRNINYTNVCTAKCTFCAFRRDHEDADAYTLNYEKIGEKIRELAIPERCTVLFSPSAEQLPARDLANWILEDRLPVRFQIQLHKVLWGNAARLYGIEDPPEAWIRSLG